jgi:elongation factor Tu
MSDLFSPRTVVGLIGHEGHGKTTLAQALLARQAVRVRSSPPPDRTVFSISPPPTRRPIWHRFLTATRPWLLVDCPGAEPGYLSGALSALDGAVLVVAADRGVEARTRERLLLARQAGVRSVVVFLTYIDLASSSDAVDQVERAVRQLLHRLDFPGDDVPVIRGRPHAALLSQGWDDEFGRPLDDLVSALELHVRLHAGDPEAPLYFPVGEGQTVYTNEQRTAVLPPEKHHCILRGRVAQGVVAVGQEVEIVGLYSVAIPLVVRAISQARQPRQRAGPGESVRLVLHLRPNATGVGLPLVGPGQVVAAPGTVGVRRCFRARLTMSDAEAGQRKPVLHAGMAPTFWLGPVQTAGRIGQTERKQLGPGESGWAEIELSHPWHLVEGLTFACRHRRATIAHGHVEALLD